MKPGDLIQGYLEGTLTAAEAGALRQWLDADPAHFQAFAAETFLHEQLCEVLGENTVRECFLSRAGRREAEGGRPKVWQRVLGGGATAASAALLWIATALAAAAVIVVFAGIVSIVQRVQGRALTSGLSVAVANIDANSVPENRDSAPAVAQLARTSNCRWAEAGICPGGCGLPETGDELAAGRRLELESGLAEIIFQEGAHTLLQGPATLEISSPRSAFLHRGKITVTVEDAAARGFEVHTPGMKYTDLGTEFGVMVSAGGQQEVHVFRGQVVAEAGEGRSEPEASAVGGRRQTVDGKEGPVCRLPSTVRRLPPSPASSLLLSAQQAIRVDSPAKPIEHMTANQQQFVRTGQMTAAIADQSPRLRRWMAFREGMCKRADLVAYYDCQYDVSDRGVVHNLASTGDQFEGRMQGGVRWCAGRMPGKQALRFATDGTRDHGGVRVELPEIYKQITIIASLRVDRLSGGGYEMILGSDSWRQRAHALHWQLSYGKGSGFGVSDPPGSGSFYGQPHEADFVGRWVTMALTCDSTNNEERMYVDGAVKVSASRPVPAVRIGPAMIGTFRHDDADINLPERTLRGRIDEMMIFKTAFSAEEIGRICKEMSLGETVDGRR